MAKILVNFANDRFEPARKHNSKTGLTKGGFDRVVECRIEDVEESYRAKYSDILAIKRGFGLWLWKPYLIKKTALEANENDIIFYCDSGTFFIDSAEPIFEALNERSIWVSDIPLFESQWTHDRCFDIANALGDNYLNTHQIQATFFGLRVCDESIAFLEEWLALCEEPNFLNPGCIAHREDQSALSLLCKKFGIEPHKDPTQYGRLPEKYFAPGRLWEEPSHPDDVYAPFIVLHRSPEMNIKDVVRQYACAILPRSISIHLIDSNHIPPSN